MIKIFIILFTICIYLGLFYWIFNNKKDNAELEYRILKVIRLTYHLEIQGHKLNYYSLLLEGDHMEAGTTLF